MARAQDPFRTLGLTPDAGPEDIKKAFRKLALSWHPDRHSTASDHLRTEAATRFKAITEAYEVLSDDHRRAAYKAWLRAERSGPVPPWPDTQSSNAPPDPYTGAWQRARQGGAQALRSHRSEVLFVLGVTIVGLAGAAGAFEYLLGKTASRPSTSLRAKVYVAPDSTRGSQEVASSKPVPPKLADLPLSQLLALERTALDDEQQDNQ